MNPRISAIFLVATATFVVSAPAGATIVDGSGTHGFKKLTVPFDESNPDNTVGQDTFQNPILYGFDEDQNIVIGGPLAVDFGSALPNGTEVASHYVCFDPANPGASTQGFVRQDEAVDGAGSGPTAGPDAVISGDRVALRAELRGDGHGARVGAALDPRGGVRRRAAVRLDPAVSGFGQEPRKERFLGS